MNFFYLLIVLFWGCLSFSSGAFIQKTASAQKPDLTELELWIKREILHDLPIKQVRYQTASSDLNQDGKMEHLVLILDSYFCGSGGCAAFIFNSKGLVINKMTVVQPPVLLSDTTSYGWQDFMVWSNGAYRLMRYDGKSYPSNPSLQPVIKRDQEKAKAILMSTELYQQDGYDIEQREADILWSKAELYFFRFKHYGEPQKIYYASVNIKTAEVLLNTFDRINGKYSETDER